MDDVDRFSFGLAANLQRVARGSGRPESPLVAEVLAAAAQVFQGAGRFGEDSVWQFQPGVWSDHPDYAFAGRTSKVVGMSPSMVPGIGEDVSHGVRLVGILTSLAEAYPVGDPHREAYGAMRRGMARQFVKHVLVPPTPSRPCYQAMNFLDGHNGVYRWQYKDRGASWGYGAFELSGSLSLGWWALSGDAAILDAYRVMASSGCVPDGRPAGESTGTGAARGSRARSIISRSYQNDLRRLIIHLSAVLPADTTS